MWEVLDTAENVAQMSRLVRIDREAVAFFSRKMLKDGVTVPPWNSPYHLCTRREDAVSYLLVLDSLNFCFWPASGMNTWVIEYQSRRLSGYWALAACLKRAVESGIPITKAEYLTELSLGNLQRVLSGRGELQLLGDRVRILNELGLLLLEEYGGDAHRLVEAAKNSAVKLVRLLAEKLSSFRDVAGYQGQRVSFYKRGQIFAADLYGAFEGKSWGSF